LSQLHQSKDIYAVLNIAARTPTTAASEKSATMMKAQCISLAQVAST